MAASMTLPTGTLTHSLELTHSSESSGSFEIREEGGFLLVQVEAQESVLM